MAALGELVRRTADRLAEQQVGAVVVGIADGTTEIRGAGRAGGATSGPPGPDTLFEIGSVTKVFTALVLARTVLAGAASLDELLAGLLPGRTVPERDGRRITLQQLATHTSGLPRLPKGMLLPALLNPRAADPYADCTAERLLDGLARTKLRSAPGRTFRYSNLGAGLLGLALARRAGTDYEQLVRSEVCLPLGLTDTTVTPGPDAARRLAGGHTAGRRPTAAWNLADLAGAGALRSTGNDLAAFLRAQLGGAPAGTAEAIALTRQVEHRTGPSSWTHLGWSAHRLHPRLGGHLQIWHNGRTGGFASYTGFDPETGTAVAVLGNTGRSVDAPAVALLRALQDAAAGRAPGGQ
ncbi:serine hydrolase domain-containing protein [Kitasatospora sp. DSM 101779]|uniref:serine hydrolase domain-containing protein n=1 Tax=Kitasatospora sp. DSM 101779 TaxID=2853165 RepID=UPI0021D94CDF|nr:serine hydrolase domain-containing protein [Kitasatospora sp. DSM 101779]MCU7820699.1 beta-lactamase family protein [Kitasatospora sp. DSM 101779]